MTTKTAQFTPGPWRISGCQLGQKLLIEHGDEETLSPIIGSVYEDGGRLPQSANATLIAAAPAMYEALQHAAMSYHHPACKCKGEYSANPERYCTCHVQKARAALAQAEGRQA